MDLEMGFQAGEVAGELRGLAVERLDIRGGDDPAGLGGLGLAKPVGRLGVLLADQRDLGQANPGRGRRGSSRAAWKITLLGLLEFARAEQAITHDHELSGSSGVFSSGRLRGSRRRGCIGPSGRRRRCNRAPRHSPGNWAVRHRGRDRPGAHERDGRDEREGSVGADAREVEEPEPTKSSPDCP